MTNQENLDEGLEPPGLQVSRGRRSQHNRLDVVGQPMQRLSFAVIVRKVNAMEIDAKN
jgi:hypothetical protein